jgi:hypothetical protein
MRLSSLFFRADDFKPVRSRFEVRGRGNRQPSVATSIERPVPRIYERSVLFMSKVKVISMSSDCEKCDASSVPA